MSADVAELVARAAGGEQAAYDALVDRYARLVWSITRNHRLSAADAADASQTVWLRLVEQLGRLREPERVGAWLATTTRHECLAVLRRGSRAVPTDDDAFAGAEVHLGASTPSADSEALESAERRRAVRAALAAMDERCRMLLTLLHGDPPATYDEITAAMAMPVGSIGPTRQRCLGKLRVHPAIVGITGGDGDSAAVRS